MTSQEDTRLAKTVRMANQLVFSDLILTLQEEVRLRQEYTLAIRLANMFCPDPGQKEHSLVPQSVQDLV